MKLTIKPNGVTELPQDWIDSLPSWGACDNAMFDIMEWNKVDCDRSAAIQYLVNIGFSEREDLELEDDYTLTKHVLWIALLDCRENKSTEWYMGL
jgi:hypothetical protein